MAKRKPVFPKIDVATLSNGSLLCTGDGRMVVPDGSPHVRQAEFRLPLLEKGASVQATVYPVNSEGPAFVIYALVVNQLPGETQVAISAQIQSLPITTRPFSVAALKKYVVRCAISVVGRPDRQVPSKGKKKYK